MDNPALNPTAQKLHRLAEAVGKSAVAEDMHKLADEVQHAMERWHEAVDAWLANEAPNLEAVKKRAFEEYQSLAARAASILAARKV